MTHAASLAVCFLCIDKNNLQFYRLHVAAADAATANAKRFGPYSQSLVWILAAVAQQVSGVVAPEEQSGGKSRHRGGLVPRTREEAARPVVKPLGSFITESKILPGRGLAPANCRYVYGEEGENASFSAKCCPV